MLSQPQSIQNIVPLFDIVDGNELKTITSKPMESKCFVYVKRQSLNSLTDKKQVYPVILQLYDEHVIQFCPRRLKVISAFICDYSHQFEIVRKSSIQVGKPGQPQGIRIHLKYFTKPLDCLIKSEAKIPLQHFAKTLGQKYITQLGFHNLFKAIRKIGKGMTACVYNALCYTTDKQVAIKSFRRSVYFASQNNNGQISFKKQFKFLTKINHKNLCKFLGVFETENSTYVIMQLLQYSLYGYLQKFGFPPIEKAKLIMKGLLEGIQYLHEKGIMHRDLKLQNIMVKKDPQSPNQFIPVIVDLGLAQNSDANQYLYVRCGTPGYVAPEVLKIKSTDEIKKYTCKCDIFSLGVVFYILLFQKALFEGADVQQVVKKNSQCQIDFQSNHFSLLAEEGKDLFKKMLEKDPTKRITATEALNHPFFTGQNLKELRSQSVCQNSITMENIEQNIEGFK